MQWALLLKQYYSSNRLFECFSSFPFFTFLMHLQLSLLLLLFSHLASSMLLGWVESPGYPRGYPPHASFNWSRCARKGHTITVSLIHLDLEDSLNCENDVVKVGLPTKKQKKNIPVVFFHTRPLITSGYRCFRMEARFPFCVAKKVSRSFDRL